MTESKSFKITLSSTQKSLSTAQTSLLEALNENDIEIHQSCGGMGSCGTCRVLIKHNPNPLPPRNSIEQEMADDRGFSDDERLSCQLAIKSDLTIEIP